MSGSDARQLDALALKMLAALLLTGGVMAGCVAFAITRLPLVGQAGALGYAVPGRPRARVRSIRAP